MFNRTHFGRFFNLVNASGSSNQMDRINSRLDMPKFVKEVGSDVCDKMYALIESGVTPTTLKEEDMK